ncbi:MAG: metal ABC transporter substrate-binding protein [Verrucomicrobiota bacterium]
MKQLHSICWAIAALSLLISCDSESEKTNSAPAAESKVFVSNYPLAYFARRLSADPGQIYFPKISGDPAFWQPTAEDISIVQQCNPLILNGATYEKWLNTVTVPRRRIVDTSASFQDQWINIENEVTHQHGPKGPHSHNGIVFTTWIDLSLAARQAQSLAGALDPTANPDWAHHLKSLISDLDGLDTKLKKLTNNKPQLQLVASHPIYQYFARAYNLDIQAVLWEPDVYPDEEQWQALEKILTTHPAQWMIWEGPPLEKSVQRLKKMGLGSVVFEPCANQPGSGDFLSVMQQNIKNLRPVFVP